jgi:hypothetical protein
MRAPVKATPIQVALLVLSVACSFKNPAAADKSIPSLRHEVHPPSMTPMAGSASGVPDTLLWHEMRQECTAPRATRWITKEKPHAA